LTGLGTGESASPTFREGLKTDQVTDAVLESARSRSWQRV
jgi:myo-inositol 2-dehydrogenase/D-chiro-inositol 1-dehydrogenase